ncbi:hypothetical protein [Lysobacter sp. Root604]|uniref:hypothetical protein n=1 Tax=Lysobacter sp. Root604 TaxID=1736568 RepID=UPI0012FB1633|nr:hypothetical protein [Lysobacter sp. Root604]
MRFNCQEEVFQTGFLLKGRVVWFAWVASTTGSDYFMVENGVLLWSCERADLEIRLRDKGYAVEKEASYFDVDALVGGLRRGFVVSPELALNVWNLFTDFYSAIHRKTVAMFCAEFDSDGLYERLFSLCEVARAVDLEAAQLSVNDVKVLCEIVEAGLGMVDSHVHEGRGGKAVN